MFILVILFLFCQLGERRIGEECGIMKEKWPNGDGIEWNCEKMEKWNENGNAVKPFSLAS
jgi:hypothetical protein